MFSTNLKLTVPTESVSHNFQSAFLGFIISINKSRGPDRFAADHGKLTITSNFLLSQSGFLPAVAMFSMKVFLS
jgi:hypothetical protein